MASHGLTPMHHTARLIFHFYLVISFPKDLVSSKPLVSHMKVIHACHSIFCKLRTSRFRLQYCAQNFHSRKPDTLSEANTSLQEHQLRCQQLCPPIPSTAWENGGRWPMAFDFCHSHEIHIPVSAWLGCSGCGHLVLSQLWMICSPLSLQINF